ncbi:MAG: hypothetical protein AAGC72_03760 [Planctomycetota bacterium]
MYVYAGIDEAGYGPMYGPLVVGCCTLLIPKLAHDAPPPALWQRLSKSVCKRLQGRKGRIVVNDSKKLTTKAAGIKHLEAGLLAFAGLDGSALPSDLSDWLTKLGEQRHHSERQDASPPGLDNMPWYAPAEDRPWETLPFANTPDELAIARSMLHGNCHRIGIELGGITGSVIYEDQFNRMVAATRSKASVSFTFVARHLVGLYEAYGTQHPHVAVDRQSGRTRYRPLLADLFEGAGVDVVGETSNQSTYRITGESGQRSMTVSFMVEAEQKHMPVALASMTAKYTRELLMHRFNTFFTRLMPDVKPTAGYGSDANRWRDQALPLLRKAHIDHDQLRRMA